MNNEHPILPASKVKSVVGIRRTKYRKVTWHTAELWLRTFLTMSEFEDMINGIRAYCGSGSDVIRLSLVDFATRLNVITSYAFVELPSEVDDLYRIIYDSDLFQTVCNNVNKNQIEAALSFVHGYYGIAVR